VDSLAWQLLTAEADLAEAIKERDAALRAAAEQAGKALEMVAELKLFRNMDRNLAPGAWTRESRGVGYAHPGASMVTWRHAEVERCIVLELYGDGAWGWSWNDSVAGESGSVDSGDEVLG